MKKLVDVKHIAREFERTERYVQGLVRWGMPRAGHGQYDLEKCKSWYIHWLQAKVTSRKDDGSEEQYDVERERARHIKAQAELAELQLAERRGEILTTETFRERMAAMISSTRQQLLNLPVRVAHELVGLSIASAKQRLRDEIHAALSALTAGSEDDGDPTTSADAAGSAS